MILTYDVDVSYTIAICTENNYLSLNKKLKEKGKNLEYKFEKGASASFIMNSSFIVLNCEQPTLDVRESSRCVYDHNITEHSFLEVLKLLNFLHEFIDDKEISNLEIYIGENDLEGFRLASFIHAYCQSKDKEVTILNDRFKKIAALYGPGVQKSSLGVLFSIIEYRIHYNRFPDFRELKQYHFNTIRHFQLYENENELSDMKNRLWNSPDDSKFVSALYASQRSLEKHGLIRKERDDNTRKITELEPTENGFLSVLFSDLSKTFIRKHS